MKQKLTLKVSGLIIAFFLLIHSGVSTYVPTLLGFILTNCKYVKSTLLNTKLPPLKEFSDFSYSTNKESFDFLINSFVLSTNLNIKPSLSMHLINLSNLLFI